MQKSQMWNVLFEQEYLVRYQLLMLSDVAANRTLNYCDYLPNDLRNYKNLTCFTLRNNCKQCTELTGVTAIDIMRTISHRS